MSLLDSKVAIITGGASGIGASTVRRFVEEGARVVIADIQDEAGQALVDELRGAAIYQHVDVTDEEQVAGMIDAALEQWQRLDILFNNAGIPGFFGEIAETPMRDYDLTLDVLLKGVVLGIKYAAPYMIDQQAGSIINTASVAGIEATHAGHIYSAAKAAVISLTRSVATELGASFVRVNAICPGGVATPIFGRAVDVEETRDGDKQVVAAMENILVRSQPIPRAGLPEDIANAAVYLGSDLSTFVTGHALVVDGGLTAGRQNWSEHVHGTNRLAEILHDAAGKN